jgi:hypothetical protein
LMGSPVQQAGQRTPSPIDVGDIDSRSSAIVDSYGGAVPRLIKKLSVYDRRDGE